jgi:hypothetical protein
MSQAWNAFTDSYLRQLKRPEYWGFQPDQASGSSMLPRSEEGNPWANRNQDNAKYGMLGGTKAGQVFQAPSGNIPGLNVNNMPFAPNMGASSPSQSTFTNLMTPVVGTAGKYGGQTIADWMRGPASTMTDLSDKIVLLGSGEVNLPGFASSIVEMGDKGLEGITSQSGDAFKGISDAMTQESTKGLSDAISGVDVASGIDPTSLASGGVTMAAPMLAKMFGLKGTAGDAVGAAAGVGTAAMQGFLNPISDVSALYSLFKLFKGLF